MGSFLLKSFSAFIMKKKTYTTLLFLSGLKGTKLDLVISLAISKGIESGY